MADMFIRIDNIAGEAQDALHSNEIEVQSWKWKSPRRQSMCPVLEAEQERQRLRFPLRP